MRYLHGLVMMTALLAAPAAVQSQPPAHPERLQRWSARVSSDGTSFREARLGWDVSRFTAGAWTCRLDAVATRSPADGVHVFARNIVCVASEGVGFSIRVTGCGVEWIGGHWVRRSAVSRFSVAHPEGDYQVEVWCGEPLPTVPLTPDADAAL